MSTPPRDEELEALLFDCLERIEHEGWTALDAVCAAHPAQAAALRESLAALQGAGLVAAPTGAPGDSAFPERLGEFRLVRRLGGGGMGVVFLAEQPSLGRDVALKLIRPDQLYFPHARERFQREIEAIARLSHTGIVQVFSVGEDKGIPFYAMEHVRGLSLADVIAAFEGRRPDDLGGQDLAALLSARAPRSSESGSASVAEGLFRGSWAETATRIGRLAARAIEHAHARGVLHRDLKPSNVMLTAEGRVVLLDFGLASLMGADRITRTGSQLGSLPYMAPEQIRGDVAAIGPAADVYALGVTLYELLTLRPAFQDDTNSEALRRKILDGRKVSPRQLHRGLSRDLAVVVEQAMSPEVNQRYPSATALAADLEAVGAMRAIAARPPSALDRAVRWTRRSPARATATVLAITLIVGGPVAFAWQQYRANERVRAKNAELAEALTSLETTSEQRELQRAAAERNLRKAVAVVDSMLTRVGQDSLRDIPQMTAVQRGLLEDALAFYKGFLAEREGDEALRREVALARMRVASVRARMGETAEVDRDLTVVIDELQALAVPDSAQPQLIAILARALGTRGEARARLGRMDEALVDVDAAVATLDRTPDELRDATFHAELAGHHDKLYDIHFRAGRFPDALAAAERAVEISRAGLEQDPGHAPLELGLGRQLDHVGGALLRLGDAEDSLEHMLGAVQALERYHIARRADSQGREKLMAARINTANTFNALGRTAEAEEYTRGAIALGEALVREFPDVHSYRSGYALALNQSCFYSFQRGDLAGAAEELGLAIAQQEAIAAGRPADIGLRAEMAGAYSNLAVVELELDRAQSSLANADRALAAIDLALTRVPGQRQWGELRRTVVFNKGRAVLALGRWREASELARSMEPSGDAVWHTNRAQLLERSARLASADMALDTALRASEASGLRAAAIADLASASALAPNDWLELADPDEWTSLRDLPEFQALVAGARGK